MESTLSLKVEAVREWDYLLNSFVDLAPLMVRDKLLTDSWPSIRPSRCERKVVPRSGEFTF